MKAFATISLFFAVTVAVESAPPLIPKGVNPPEVVKPAEPSEGPPKTQVDHPVAVSTIEPDELLNFESYQPEIQHLIRAALALTKLKLRYTFGSSDPKAGGMDCSGTISHLLRSVGLQEVPRQSDEMCGWVQKATVLHRTATADSLTHAELTALRPGDLLFWSGTYDTGQRKLPISHVMLYLGQLKKGHHPVVFGASNGRTYQGERRNGVSVFDFTLPKPASPSKLFGYGLIPGVGQIKTPLQKAPSADIPRSAVQR
jgi:NlpC/P60 family